jgi:hypothetical protein
VTHSGDIKNFEPVEIDLKDHPGAIVCPIFSPARIFSAEEPWFKVAIAGADGYEARITKLGGNVLVGGKRPPHGDIARFYAKIAHSFAVATFGVGSFIPILTQWIRGERDLQSLWQYVGGQLPKLPVTDTGDHLHALAPMVGKLESGETLLLVRISLFAADKLPSYDVVVGTATLATPLPPLKGSQHATFRLAGGRSS